VAELMRAERRGLLLYPALLALGMGALASCATEPPPLPRTATMRVPPPPPDSVATPRPVPRPPRKPAPPAPSEAPAPAAVGAPLALTPPKPPASTPTPEVPAPEEPAPASASAGPGSPGQTAPPSPEAGELIGLDQPAAARLFGPAAERSEQPPATVWRYKNATCELDLFFYLDLSSGQMRTLHYAFKGNGAATTRRQDCLRSLAASRGG